MAAAATRLATLRATAPLAAKLARLEERAQPPQALADAPFSLASLLGRCVEVSGQPGHTAALSVAMRWVLEAQRQGELAAWVQLAPAAASAPRGAQPAGGGAMQTFYPPDVAALGVDLSALPVVMVPSMAAAARASEQLLRSGAFALLVLDTCTLPIGSAAHGAAYGAAPQLSMAMLSRLLGLAQAHASAFVCLSEKSPEAPSLGSLVSLRLQAVRREGSIICEAIKDKRVGPGAIQQQPALPVDGMGTAQ